MRETVLHESGENYLKEIFILQKSQGNVYSIDIARKLGLSKPSVSRAMKILKEIHLIDMDDDKIIKLTDLGEKKAHSILQRYLLIEQFLTSNLKVDKKTASEDACRMEHCISEETLNKMQVLVNNTVL